MTPTNTIDINPTHVPTRWKGSDPEAFFRFVEDIQPMVPSAEGGYEVYSIPEELKPEFRRILDPKVKTAAICWPRRHGKTLAAALIIIWRFLTRKTQSVAMVANSSRQAEDVAYRLVRTILQQTPVTKAMIDAGYIVVQREKITYESLNGIIQAFPASPAALYGKKVSIAQCSEYHAAASDEVYQVMASSTVDSVDGLTLIDSTVGSKSSPLYALYQLAQSGLDDTLYFSHISYENADDAINNAPPWISKEALKSRHLQMLPAQWIQQHENRWTDSLNSVFPEDVMALCTEERYSLDPESFHTVAQGRTYVVGAGVDRAAALHMMGDSTISAAVLKYTDNDEDHFYVLACDKVHLNSAQGIKNNLLRYARDFSVQAVTLESYNSTDIQAWAAERPEFNSELVSPTGKTQSSLFQMLYQIASAGRLHIHPTMTRLIEEMLTFEYTENNSQQGQHLKFQHQKGKHDDCIYALAWAIYSLRTVELNPYTLDGISCDADKRVAKLCVMFGGDITPLCADRCPSYHAFRKLYDSYRETSAGAVPLKETDFMRYKVQVDGPVQTLR